MIFDRIKAFLKATLRAKGKNSFFRCINANSDLLDVGCGNDSPYYVKMACPGIRYTGIDVGNHNHTKSIPSNSYIVVTPDRFAWLYAVLCGT